MNFRKIVLVTLVVLLFASSSIAHAQREKMAVNLGGLLIGIVGVEYEERLGSNFSYILELSSWQLNNVYYNDVYYNSISNAGVGIGNRFYPGHNALNGIYFDSALIISMMNTRRGRMQEDGVRFSSGLSIGHQWVIPGWFTADIGYGVILPIFSIYSDDHSTMSQFGGSIGNNLKFSIGYAW